MTCRPLQPASGRLLVRVVVSVFALAPTSAFAHSEAAGSGLLAGLLHPLTGADHLLAMLAVGIASVLMGGASIWRVPAAFVTAMVIGAWGGYRGLAVPFAEAGIALSVMLLGAAIAWAPLRRYGGAVFGGVFLFGLCHGGAHGAELPRTALPLFYSMGFFITTLFIHVCGIFIGAFASGSHRRRAGLRALGIAMAATGFWFAWR
jgi:urease accessory protein